MTLLRSLAILASTAVVLAGSANAQDKVDLDGTWLGVKIIHDGRSLPKEKIEGGKLIIKGDRMTLVQKGGPEIEHTIKIDTSKKPYTIDIVKVDDPNSKILGIFRLEKDQLILCIALPSNKQRPQQFTAPAGSSRGLLILRRQKKKN